MLLTASGTQIAAEFGFEPVCINSALVSAQNRQRLYWLGRREEDGTYSRVDVEQPEDRGILLRDILESEICWQEKGYCLKAQYAHGVPTDDSLKRRQNTQVAEPLGITEDGKAYVLRAQYAKSSVINSLDGGHFPAPFAAEPARIGTIESGTDHPENDSSRLVIETEDGKTYPVYEALDGQITIKGKQYPIKLADGLYIIRKLTVTECKRLQTVPEWYVFPVSDTQAYKMLGNGWTVDVIAHILSRIPGITTGPVEVLSMYDGMSCGHIALDKLGVEVSRYYATEIDKYAIQTTQRNYPETVQLGDAFQVRDEGWSVGEENDCGYEGAGLGAGV